MKRDNRRDDHAVRYVNVSFIMPSAYWPTDILSLADGYKRSLDRFAPQVAAIVRTIAAAPEGGVLVHCAAGKDRTGLVIALLLDLAGVPRDVIAADYALSSENLRERTREWIERVPEQRAEREAEMARGRTRPEVMLEVLAHLDERYGGTEGYLLAAGCRESDFTALRERLLLMPGSPRPT
jgi:protein-tyrosine phosphatase